MPKTHVIFITKLFSAQAKARQYKYLKVIQHLGSEFRISVVTPKEIEQQEEPQVLPGNLTELVTYNYLGYFSRYCYLKYRERVRKTWHTINQWFTRGNRQRQQAPTSLQNSRRLALLFPYLFPDAYIGIIFPAFLHARKVFLANRLNTIIVTGCYPFSNLFVGLIMKNLYPQIKWIVELRDPFANNPQLENNRLWAALAKRFEHLIFRSADCIWIYEGWFPDPHKYFLTHHSSQLQKICTLPPCGYDESLFEDAKKQAKQNTSQFRIIYAGNFYGGNHTPEEFLRAVSELLDEGTLPDTTRVDFYGNGSHYQTLADTLDLNQIVTFHEFLEYKSVITEMFQSDALLWIHGRLTNHQSANDYSDNLPSKLFDYIGVGKPILAICPEGKGRELVKKYWPRFTASPGNHFEIKNALTAIIEERNNKEPEKRIDLHKTGLSLQDNSEAIYKSLKFLSYS